MSIELPTRVQTGAMNVLGHLTRDHPDTILFLARHLSGRPDSTGASVVAVDSDGVDLEVAGAAGPGTARLVFTSPISTVLELQRQVRGWLGAARAEAPDEPLTSLEHEMASRPSTPHGH